MIYFESPYLNIEGLTIFRDHENKRQYYYYPNAPRLALQPDGSPAFLFVKYREDLSNLPVGSDPGGGFLSFDVDLRVDQDALDTAKREIKREFNLDEDPILAPLDYRDGTVRLIFLDYEEPKPEDEQNHPTGDEATPEPERFVVAAKYGVRPSLYGDNRAAFSVQLSSRGATLLEETLDARSSLIGVVYDLAFVGLRPAYEVKLSIDWDRVYKHFEEGYKADFLFVNADISNAVDKLIEQQVIQLDVISFGAGEADADIIDRKDEAVQFVREYITDKFFEPSLNPQEALSSKWYNELAHSAKSFRPFSFGYTRRSLERIDKKSLDINMRERSAVERKIAPQGHLQGLLEVLKDLPREDFIKTVDLRDPFFQRVQVDVVGAASLATDGIDAVSVHLEYGPEGMSEPRDVLLRKSGDTGQVSWALDPTLGLSYRYRYEVVFGPTAPPGSSHRLESPTITTNETRLIIDPRDLYGVQQVLVEPANLPFDLYPKVEVNLRYSDPINELNLVKTILLEKDLLKTERQWVYRLSDPNRTAYEYCLTYYPVGAEPIEGNWKESLDPAVLVSDLYPNTLEVEVAPAGNFAEINRIIVTMAYEDTINNINQRKILIFSEDTVETWQVRLVDNRKRDYTYQATIQYKNNVIKRFPPIRATDAFLLVGDVFERLVKVKVSALGVPFDRAGLSRVIIQLSYDDAVNNIHESKEVVLRSLDDTYDWEFKMNDPLLEEYTYELTYIQDDGFRRREQLKTSKDENLIIPIRA